MCWDYGPTSEFGARPIRNGSGNSHEVFRSDGAPGITVVFDAPDAQSAIWQAHPHTRPLVPRDEIVKFFESLSR